MIAAWLDHLSRDPALPAQLLLPLVPEQGAFADALETVLAREGRRSAAFGRHERALLAPGARARGYLERAMSANKRKKLRRQRRRLEDIAPVTVNTATGTADIEAALKDFMVLEASGWKGRAGTAIVSDPGDQGFRAEARSSALAAEGQARIDRLFLNGTAIAATMTLASGDTAWCWKIAYNEGFARSSPGVQLMCDLTESLLAGAAAAARQFLRRRRPPDDRPCLARAAGTERPADRVAALRDAVCARLPDRDAAPLGHRGGQGLRDRMRGR